MMSSSSSESFGLASLIGLKLSFSDSLLSKSESIETVMVKSLLSSDSYSSESVKYSILMVFVNPKAAFLLDRSVKVWLPFRVIRRVCSFEVGFTSGLPMSDIEWVHVQSYFQRSCSLFSSMCFFDFGPTSILTVGILSKISCPTISRPSI